MARRNGHDIEVTRPLSHRPGVMVVRSNGIRKVIGDGSPFTTSEYLTLVGGYMESTTPRLKFTDEEQTELDAAQDRLQRASEIVDRLYAEGAGLSAEMKEATYNANPYSQRTLTDQEQDTIRNIEVAGHELIGRINEASDLERSALKERNAIQQRITVAARARQFPPTFHEPKLSIDEHLTNLEGRE